MYTTLRMLHLVFQYLPGRQRNLYGSCPAATIEASGASHPESSYGCTHAHNGRLKCD